MAITLNAISLPNQTRWLEELSYTPVRQETDVTLGGKTVVYTQQLSKGTPITLDISVPRAWIDWTTLQSIKALADVAGEVVSLNWHGTLYSCMFAHPGALEVRAVQDLNDRTKDVFEITIKLIEV